jgi:membrane protein insertase Oxa1/YidC/SpoIIIJ
MSDLAHEDAMSDTANADAENSTATIDTVNAETTGDSVKPNAIAAILLKVWSAIMLVSTAILSFYVLVLKDDSAIPFVVLGVIGLCLPQMVSMYRAMARSRRLQEELEERIRMAHLERVQQAREREMERLQREKMMAQCEVAEQDAIKNTDVEAYKLNNSMQ